jgi:DNA-binding transcriptional regulator YiaG
MIHTKLALIQLIRLKLKFGPRPAEQAAFALFLGLGRLQDRPTGGHNAIMPNIASVLKAEITRIARKELRAEIEGLKKTASSHRSDIAALKRRCQSLEQELRRFGKTLPKPAPASPGSDTETHLRFSAKGLASHRRRLELSADALGLLLGASGQSVYNWESGAARPRPAHMPAIAALRSLSKRQAAEIVAARKAA